MCTRKMKNCLALFCLLLPCSNAQGFSYLWPDSLAVLQTAPAVYTGQLSGRLGEMWYVSPSWHVAQWGIEEELPTTIDCLGNCYDNEWQTANAYATIYAKDGTLTLRQDSRDDNFGCREFDLYIEPNDLLTYSLTYPDSASGLLPFSDRPSLADSKNLVVEVTQEVREASHDTRCPPGWNLATTLIALTFLNTTSDQVIFYQLITYDSRGEHFTGFWFFSGPTEYGVNDSVDVLGFSPLVLHEGPVAYSINVLSRVTELIANGPEPLDKDLHHWKVSGLYLGSATNGEARIVSSHSNINLVGDLK
jgi:hypothetical protein